MALIEMTTDLKALTHQATRIADALTELLRAAYGIHLEPLKVTLNHADKDEVAYSDDLGTLRQEFKDVHDGRPPDRAVDVDEVEF